MILRNEKVRQPASQRKVSKRVTFMRFSVGELRKGKGRG